MNDFLDLLFKLVSLLIAIYIVAHYLTWINVFDKKKSKLYVNEALDTDTILYCLVYVFGCVSTGAISIKIKWSMHPYLLIPITLIFAFISLFCFKKNIRSKVLPFVATFINGLLVGLVFYAIIDSFNNLTPTLILYLFLIAMNFITSLVFVGRLRVNDELHVFLYLENRNLISLFTEKHSAYVTNDKSYSYAYIKAILIDEKDDHYFIEIVDNKELYRLPKDQVILIEPQSNV